MTTFQELMAEVTAPAAGRFGHREHVHLTWLAVHRCGLPAAATLVGAGIADIARSAGVPRKYHVTVTRAWTELIAHHATEPGAGGEPDFAAFAARNPALLDQDLLARFYCPATLASPRARAGWLEPDRAPFPWTAPPRA